MDGVLVSKEQQISKISSMAAWVKQLSSQQRDINMVKQTVHIDTSNLAGVLRSEGLLKARTI